MHKHAAGAYARGFFACNKTQRAEDSDEEDEEEEHGQAAFKARCCHLLFAILTTIFCENIMNGFHDSWPLSRFQLQ